MFTETEGMARWSMYMHNILAFPRWIRNLSPSRIAKCGNDFIERAWPYQPIGSRKPMRFAAPTHNMPGCRIKLSIDVQTTNSVLPTGNCLRELRIIGETLVKPEMIDADRSA
jgi:hypothetical protein